MKNRIASVIIILVSALAVLAQKRVMIGGPGPDPAKDWPKPELHAGLSDAQITSSIAEYAKTLSDTNHFSGVVLVAKDGKVMSAAYGLANAESKTPNTIDTKFNIGSINKIFTKTAVAQLAQAGKLSLDDTVKKHLPDFPAPYADKITIRQLVDHRSGMGDIFGPKYDAAPPSKLRELSDFVPLFAAEPLGFEPGTSERYSNAGYVTLGLIIERITGEKYRDYVSKNIFAPAAMKSTGFWAIDEPVTNRVTGYTLHGYDRELTERIPNTNSLPGRPSSAGGAYATAADLLRFYDALLSGKLLSQKWTNWMMTGSFDERPGKPAIGVAGGAPGLNTAVEMNNGWTVIAMANFDPPAASALARGAMDIIRGRKEEGEMPGGLVIRRGPTAPAKTELPSDVTVPATMMAHLFTIEATINGKGPYRFAVDSGAGGMMRISEAVQKALQLEQIGEARSGDPSGKNLVSVPIVRADSVEIGGARFSGVDTAVGNVRGGDGVVGLRLFATLTATLDYGKRELRLNRKPLDAGGAHTVAYTTPRGIPVIDIDVAGAPMTVDVDTGSPAALTIPASWAAKVPLNGEPVVVGKGRTISNEFEIRAADLRGDLRVAGFTRTAPRVDIVDLFPVANLGSRFLRDYVVTFDVANQRMALGQ
jgi:CubicO group peptidase (beta-lactamase class C family)